MEMDITLVIKSPFNHQDASIQSALCHLIFSLEERLLDISAFLLLSARHKIKYLHKVKRLQTFCAE